MLTMLNIQLAKPQKFNNQFSGDSKAGSSTQLVQPQPIYVKYNSEKSNTQPTSILQHVSLCELQRLQRTEHYSKETQG